MSEIQMEKIRVTMLVCFGNQRRPIEIRSNDDIDKIEKTIRNNFHLEVNDLSHYQIQYFDADYEKFVDLYSKSLTDFRNLLKRLSSPNAPPKSTREWLLKLTERSTPSRRQLLEKIFFYRFAFFLHRWFNPEKHHR